MEEEEDEMRRKKGLFIFEFSEIEAKSFPTESKFQPFLPITPQFHQILFFSRWVSQKNKRRRKRKRNHPVPSIGVNPIKFAICVVLWASFSLLWFARSRDAKAATNSIKSSSFGLRIAANLRRFGWPDEAVVFALARLPVIELCGDIPVGYWRHLKPTVLTFFSDLGNMVPVPFIVLYLKSFAYFLAGKSQAASKLLEILFKRAKEKAGPVEEFQWLGLMLFIAVPFPGTGAWTGAIIAAILEMHRCMEVV